MLLPIIGYFCMTINPVDFFDQDCDLPIVRELCMNINYVWQLLPNIEPLLNKLLQRKQVIEGNVSSQAYIGNSPVYIAKTASIEPGAYVMGPAYIGDEVVIRHGAYVRDNVIMLKGSLLGHASEAKNSLFFPYAHAPHFNYIGVSKLGSVGYFGAGSKLSILTVVSEKDPKTGERPTIKITINGTEFDTKLTKLGAILGNYAQTGCNSVLNPGCLVGKSSLVYAYASLRKGYYPPNKLIMLHQEVEVTERF